MYVGLRLVGITPFLDPANAVIYQDSHRLRW